MKAHHLSLAAFHPVRSLLSALQTMDEDASIEQLLTPAMVQISAEGSLPPLTAATTWLNSPPLSATDLRGKVVLVEFWTYTCINWLRTLPYVRAWAEKYKEQGLVVIGVHTPEFPVEYDLDHVRRAAKDLNVAYPIAIDNDYALWNAFDNRYWPALYFVDARGHIRHHRFGEGHYEDSEVVIQRLLTDAGIEDVYDGFVMVEAGGVEAAADWGSLESMENYVGYERTEHFASPEGAALGQRRVYSAPTRLRLNHWALSGEWSMQEQAVVLHVANGRIAYRFHARDLHLVMGPSTGGSFIRFRVRLDGEAPGAARGSDVDEQGFGTADYPRLYQLIRQSGAIEERLFEIEFLDAGAEAFAFTFG